MQRSTARRERLISPLSLALMAGLFMLAFFILKPSSIPGDALVDKGSISDIDELDLAYLRARKHAGKASDTEVISVLERLSSDGRHDEVRSLLADYPQLQLSEALRYELDLERSAQASPIALFAALTTLRDTPALHRSKLLARGVQLSKPLDQPELSAELYSRWADTGDTVEQSLARYRQCGTYLASVDQRTLAMACFERALTHAAGEKDAFEIRLAMLPLSQQDSLQRDVLVRDLIGVDALEAEQRQRLADVLLAVERPDVAYRVYAKLAVQEPERADTWLPLAARWAEAAGKPAEAAVFLDSLANVSSGEQRRQLQQRVESLLLSAGRGRDAYERLQQRLRQQPDDVAALQQGIVVARQLDENSQALHWNTRLLSFRPTDKEASRVQRELALAVGNLPLAMRWAERVLEQNPQSSNARVQLARISEWNGKPELALQHWQRQSRNEKQLTSRVAALREVVRLAEMTLQPDKGATALREVTLLQKPGPAEVVKLTTLYELDGRAEQASVALQDIAALHGVDPFLLRTLATHEYHHSRYEQSLSAWDQYVESFGHDVEATLSRTELLWRLDQKDAAADAADRLEGHSLLALASDYQLRLMAEIAWRYRKSWLFLLVQPRIEALDEQDQRTLHGRRSLAVLQQRGDNTLALRESMQLWRATGESDFALTAMQLALKVDDQLVLERLSPGQSETRELQRKPAYWTQLATVSLRQGDVIRAREAFERALRLDAAHVESIAGLIWLAIGEQDEALLQRSLDSYAELALTTPELWQAMAMGYLQLGAAASSLAWFDRLLEQIEADYGMLLTYADALEYAGRSAAARSVRQYTLQQLRPLLVSSSEQEQAMLLRQYSRLSARYAGVESNEQLINHLLKTGYASSGANEADAGNPGNPNDAGNPGNPNEAGNAGINGFDSVDGVDSVARVDGDELWREDMAISWLMSTQQHEHARLIMTRIHERRLRAPAWQQLALALKDDDEAALNSLIQAKGPLSVGNHILALRQLGHDREAYALAQQAVQPGATLAGSALDDRRVAQEQYVSLRNARPSFIAGTVDNRNTDGLQIRESGVRLRHTIAGSDLGLALDIAQRQLASDQYELSSGDEVSDLALSLFFGNARQGGRLTTGIMIADDADLMYGSAAYNRLLPGKRSRFSAELSVNEALNLSPELVIGARQHRITMGLEADFGRREFIRMQADATQIHTRVEQNKVARGLGGSAELGIRGSFGSNLWSTSVRATHVQRDREDSLPDELQLSDQSSMDNVLAEEVQTLSLDASLSRGGIDTDFPQVSSPRYYINTSLGQNWPDKVVGFQIDAGAGIRVLGGDEISFSVSHDTQPSLRSKRDSTAVGVSYRYHFQ